MSNGLPHNGGTVWPPPALRYSLRVVAFALSVGAAGAAFTGHAAAAGVLASVGAAMQVADLIGGK